MSRGSLAVLTWNKGTQLLVIGYFHIRSLYLKLPWIPLIQTSSTLFFDMPYPIPQHPELFVGSLKLIGHVTKIGNSSSSIL